MPSRENLYMLSVMYKHKRITVGVGMGNPFVDNYKRINPVWTELSEWWKENLESGYGYWRDEYFQIMNFCRPCLVLFIISAIFRIFTAYYGL